MAAISIPKVGQEFHGDVPAVVKAQKVLLGGTAVTAADVAPTAVTTAQTLELVNVGAGVRILGVTAQNLVAWAAGVLISLGDSDAVSGYILTAQIAPTTSDAAPIAMGQEGVTSAYQAGRAYSASQAINVTLSGNAAGSDLEAGQTEFVFIYIESLDA